LEQLKKEIREKCAPEEMQAPEQIAARFKGLLLKDCFKDCAISIDGKEFKAHRLVIAAGSPVLSEMLEENPEAIELELQNIDAGIFEILLDFMYGNLNSDGLDDISILKDLLHAAHKLEMEDFKTIAVTKMLEMVNVENAADMLILATKFEAEGLKLRAFDEIKKIFVDEKIKDDAINDPEGLKNLIELRKKYKEEAKKFT